jgi:UDP-N-acetylglucosamine transferase subunit ALG13
VIFVTVGTELPFDRMVRVVDQWAGDTGRKDFFAQIGETLWRPRHMSYSTLLEPREFAMRFASATAIVSHAGMGTILSALCHGKPILVMPRRAQFGEQRNDHQLATARQLADMGKVRAAFDEAALRTQLDQLGEWDPNDTIGAFASADLLAGVRQFIFSSQPHSGMLPVNHRRR